MSEFWRRLRCAWWTLREESCDCVQQDALEVLCRVFDDGADVAHDEWLKWYKPEEWFHPSRALGAFIYQRLSRTSDFQRGWNEGCATAAREIGNTVDRPKGDKTDG